MAKFCGNCGAQLDDSALVCGYCGTPLEADNAPANSVTGGLFAGGIKGFLTPARLKIGGIALAGIAVLIALIIIISGFFGVRGLQRDIVKVIENQDGKLMEKIYSPLAKEKNSYMDREGYFDDYFKDSDYDKVSAEVVESYDASDYEYKEFLDNYDFSKQEVEAVRICIVKVKYSKDGGYIYRYRQFVLTKEKNGWFVYSGNFG